MKAPQSLKARALQLLAQRDQSPVELRRKLLARAREVARQPSGTVSAEVVAGDGLSGDAALLNKPVNGMPAPPDPPGSPEIEVDAVLQWLEEKRFLSVERFAEARMSARAPRFGNIRIRHELAQHGAVLSEEANQALVASELDRARAVHARRFAGAPPDLKQSARQARFLAARGFSADVIRRVLRESDRDDDTPADRGRVRR